MEKRRLLIGGIPLLVLVIFLILLPNSDSLEFDNSGRAVRNQLGTLYALRSKLTSNGRVTGVTTQPITTVPQAPLTPSSPGKENGVYIFHQTPSNVQNPNYAQFQSRMGRVDAASGDRRTKAKGIKWKKAKKIESKKESIVNSFNVLPQIEVREIVLPGNNVTTEDADKLSVSTSSSAPQLSLPIPPTTPPSPLSQIQSIGQGITNAMTTILTRKLIKMLDQDVPPGVFMPLKHLVAAGNEMVDYWDKRANGRGGENPGLIEILGYGLDQLKKLRDGHAIKPSDPVANLTSPSRALIEGIVTVKRLTNRVLGHDTSNEIVGRGYGHGHDSGYGHMSYGHHGSSLYGGLDPFSLLAALAFGAFLLQLILTLLGATARRSMGGISFNAPFVLPDFHVPTLEDAQNNFFGTPTIRNKRGVQYEEPGEEMFDAILDKLDGVYRTYTQIRKTPECAQVHMCRLARQDYEAEDKSILSPLYMYGLEQLGKDQNPTRFLQSIKDRLSNGEDVDCGKIVDGCDSKPWKKS